MQSTRPVFPIAFLTVVSAAVLSLAGCSGTSASGTSTSTAPAPAASATPMLVTVGDAPLSNILSAQVTLSAVSVTPTAGGSPVSLLTTPRAVELSGLGAVQEPLESEQIPLGTYSTVSATVTGAQVTYVDASGAIVTGTAAVTQQSVSVALTPALVVTSNQSVQLRMDFNLAKSFDLTGTTLSFTPALNTAAAAVNSESAAETQVEVTGSVITISATSITVQSANSGAQSTFVVNSGTRFSANAPASSIQVGAIVDVHGAVQSDGTLLADTISASMDGHAEGQGQSGGKGIVTAVTANSSGVVTAFTFVPRQEYNGQSSSTPLNVTLASSTIYGANQDATQSGLQAGAFTNAEIFTGQSVKVLGTTTAANAITAQEVDIAAESIPGTLAAVPQGTSPSFTFSLQLSTSSYLTTYQTITTLNASTNAQTEFGNGLDAATFGSATASTNLSAHGYLLKNASGAFMLYVTDVSQAEVPETPESGG